MKIGTAIHEIRKRRGLKQKDLALSLGIRPDYLSKIENNKVEPGKKLMTNLCEKLDIDEVTLKFLAYESSDVPAPKRQSFEVLEETLKDWIKDIFV